MFRIPCFTKALIRRATRAKLPSMQNLPDEVLLNVINKLSVYDAISLSQQSCGIHALCDVKNCQKYSQLKFGREKYSQTHEAVLQAGLDTLLAILRTPSLGDYLRRVDLYGTGMIEFDPDSENSIQDSVLSPEDIDRLKHAILGAGFQDGLDFHPDDKLNEFHEYVGDPYYHRLNMVRKLPAVESVAFKLVAWSNEAGIPPPPRSANYSKISFTHSVMENWDLCRIIESAKTLKSFTSTIGGRLYPEGGHPVLYVTPIFKSLWIHRQTLE
ncbi:unnamed protein product [Penicillium glandicola]